MKYRTSLPYEHFMAISTRHSKIEQTFKNRPLSRTSGLKIIQTIVRYVRSSMGARALSWIPAPSSVHVLHCNLLPEFPGKRARLVGSTQVVLE